jgi:hypothetical protein
MIELHKSDLKIMSQTQNEEKYEKKLERKKKPDL